MSKWKIGKVFVNNIRGKSIDIIKGLEHYGEQHQSVGIGIVRTKTPKPELVITVIYGQS